MDPVLVLAGPTASGKTRIAEGLCRSVRAEIVSADSGCFHRGVEIGNGKFTIDRSLPYHMIDLCEPDERFTVRRYLTKAREAVSGIRSRKKFPIVCGGSMLYIERFVKGISAGPDPDPDLRIWMDGFIEEHGIFEAHALLRELDPNSGSWISPSDERRIRRALESSLTSLAHEPPIPRIDGDVKGIFIDRPGSILRERIRSRTETMVRSGWISEVRSLLKKYGKRPVPALEMTGVRSVLRFLEGELDEEGLIEVVSKETLDLAKSQKKWAKRLSFERIELTWNDEAEIREIFDQIAE